MTREVTSRKKIDPGAFCRNSRGPCITYSYGINDLQKISITYKLFQRLAPILNNLRASTSAFHELPYRIRNEKSSNTYSCFPSLATGFTLPPRTCWIAAATLGR